MPSMPLHNAVRVVYLDQPRRDMDRYYERSAHGGIWFLVPDGSVELVPTQVGDRVAPGVQYVRTRGPWSGPSDLEEM
jgi:hypothetical protein